MQGKNRPAATDDMLCQIWGESYRLNPLVSKKYAGFLRFYLSKNKAFFTGILLPCTVISAFQSGLLNLRL